MTNLFIFNTDFRVRDNPALFYAAENGESVVAMFIHNPKKWDCLLYTSPSPRDERLSRMPSSA